MLSDGQSPALVREPRRWLRETFVVKVVADRMESSQPVNEVKGTLDLCLLT